MASEFVEDPEVSEAAEGSHGRRSVLNDVDHAMEQLKACGIPIRISPLTRRSGRVEIKSLLRTAEGVSFARIKFEEPVEIWPVETFDSYDLMFPVTGSTTVDLGGDSVDCSRSGAVVFDTARLRIVRRSAGSENLAMFVDHKMLTNRLFELTDTPVTRRLSFQPQLDHDVAAVGALRAFVEGLENGVLPALGRAPLSAGSLSALIADLMLELLPHNYQDAMRPGSNLIAPKHVKRAIAHIRAHAGNSLATEELTRVAGVSLRALQYGFRKFLGVSISEYERAVRLDHVRREIENDPRERIGVVAKRWGFSNLTRFNTQFEAAFGVSAMTLRSGRDPGR